MDRDLLNRALEEYTRGRLGLMSALHAYLDSIRHAASVLGVHVEDAGVYEDPPGIEIAITGVVVRWTPGAGWWFEYEDEGRNRVKYWASDEWDAASLVVESEAVAARLWVLARGSRDGHDLPPEEPDPWDPALVDRLVTLGVGRDPYAPF